MLFLVLVIVAIAVLVSRQRSLKNRTSQLAWEKKFAKFCSEGMKVICWACPVYCFYFFPYGWALKVLLYPVGTLYDPPQHRRVAALSGLLRIAFLLFDVLVTLGRCF